MQEKGKSMATPAPKARRPRSDRGIVRLNDRDDYGLTWVIQQYGVCLDQMQSVLGRQSKQPTQYHEPGHKELRALGLKTTADIIARWRDIGFVQTASPLRNQAAWVWATRLGLKEQGFDYRYWELNVKALKHLYAVNQVRLWVESGEDETLRGAEWKSERALQAERPAALAGYARGHLPDAELTLPTGEVVAIEVELTKKRRSWLGEILEGLAADYAQVRYFVARDIYDYVQEVWGELDEEDQARFHFVRYG